jgi:hypothetical protein
VAFVSVLKKNDVIRQTRKQDVHVLSYRCRCDRR